MTDTQDKIPTMDALLRNYSGVEEPPPVPRIRFEDALRQGDDPLKIIPYLAGLGIAVQAPEDLFRLNDDQDEEELYCFRVREGVLAVMASDDLWLLFEVGAAGDPPSVDGAAEP